MVGTQENEVHLTMVLCICLMKQHKPLLGFIHDSRKY